MSACSKERQLMIKREKVKVKARASITFSFHRDEPFYSFFLKFILSKVYFIFLA